MDTVQGAQFEDITITFIGPRGVTTRPCKKFGDTGLGYLQDDEGRYSPTHVASGAACGGPFFSEEHCRKYLEELVPLMNWNQPLESLTSDPAYKRQAFVELYKKHRIEDAAATAGGGQW